MERCAMFIDAGYLLAESGDLFFDTLERGGKKERPSCNYGKLLLRLQKLACEYCRLPILRIYWYDGIPKNGPTRDQKEIARLPNVKVRLGRMVGGQQKGVDALIYRDLMTLAQQHTIATGYLFSGDEDLKEGVIVAQEMGVRIILLGVPSQRDPNQSDFLVREADEHIIVEEKILEPYFSDRATTAEIEEAKQVGRRFATRWNRNATPEEIHRLQNQRPEMQNQFPEIPLNIYRELLKEAEQIFGSLDKKQTLKHNLRKAFVFLKSHDKPPEKKKQTLKYHLREGFWGVIQRL